MLTFGDPNEADLRFPLDRLLVRVWNQEGPRANCRYD